MRQARLPKYSLHRATGQARVYIDGRDHYLGPYGSAESKERYRSLVNAWQLRRRTRCPASMAVGELVLLYDGHVRGYYVKNGKPTSEASLVRAALRPLVRRHAATPVLDFGPRDLRSVREEFVAADLARSTANAYTRRIVALFRWGVSEEYVPSDVLAALEAVPAIRKGRSAAREAVPVTPVPEDQVNAVLPHLSRQVRDMVRIQLLTGCRPGEVCTIRPCDVGRSGEVWEYRPASHKTEHHGKRRTILLGPRAQAVLAPYVDTRPAEAWCFSPAEAEATRHGERHAKAELRGAVQLGLLGLAGKAVGCVERAIERGDARTALALLKGLGCLDGDAFEEPPADRPEPEGQPIGDTREVFLRLLEHAKARRDIAERTGTEGV